MKRDSQSAERAVAAAALPAVRRAVVRAAPWILLLLPALLAAGCSSSAAGRSPAAQIERAIDHLVPGGGSVVVAVAYSDLGRSVRVVRNEERDFPAAGLVRLPVLMAAYAQIERGNLDPARGMAVHADFASLVDGSRFSLRPEADADADLYHLAGAAGGAVPAGELIRHLAARGSTLASMLLVERFGASDVSDQMRRIGATRTVVLHGGADPKALAAGFDNVVSAGDLELALAAIAGRPSHAGDPHLESESIFSARSTSAMVELLRAAPRGRKIAAGLPPEVPLAHVEGDLPGYHHDAALVYPPGEAPYILVVLTSGIADPALAERAIANLSRAVWQARSVPSGPASSLTLSAGSGRP